MRECWVHDTVTGVRLRRVFPSGGSWTSKVDGVGDSSLTFRLLDPRWGLDRATARDLFQPNKRTLVVTWGSHVESATVNSTASWDRDTGVLTVQGRTVREFASQRLTFGVDNYANGDLTITNRTHAGAVRAILTRMTQWNTDWALPLDLPADASGTYSKAVKNYDVAFIESLLGQIEAEGYEIGFRPYLDANYSLRYQVQVSPQITVGGATTLPISVKKSRVKSFKVVEDGAALLTGVFVVGNGTEADMSTGWAGTGGVSGMPIRDASISAKDVRDGAALTRTAAAELAARVSPIVQRSFSVQVDEEFSPELISPGRLLDMDVRGDGWTPDGVARFRSVSLRSDYGSLTVSPEVQAYGS